MVGPGKGQCMCLCVTQEEGLNRLQVDVNTLLSTVVTKDDPSLLRVSEGFGALWLLMFKLWPGTLNLTLQTLSTRV